MAGRRGRRGWGGEIFWGGERKWGCGFGKKGREVGIVGGVWERVMWCLIEPLLVFREGERDVEAGSG